MSLDGFIEDTTGASTSVEWYTEQDDDANLGVAGRPSTSPPRARLGS